MYEELTDLFIEIIHQTGSYDIAHSEFKRMIEEDAELRRQYIEWCDENGYSFRNGFSDFCEEYLNEQNSAMESLSEYDE